MGEVVILGMESSFTGPAMDVMVRAEQEDGEQTTELSR